MNVKKSLIIANVIGLSSLALGMILTPFYNGIYKVYWISFIFLIPLIISFIFSLYCSLTEEIKIGVPKRNSKAAQSTAASGSLALMIYFIFISVFSFYDILLIPIYGFLALSGTIPISVYWKILKKDEIEKNKEKPETSSIEIEVKKILTGANLISLISLVYVIILVMISNLYKPPLFHSSLFMTIGLFAVSLYISFTGKTLPSRYGNGRIDATITTLGSGTVSLFINLLFVFDFITLNPILILIFVFIVISGVIPILAYKKIINLKKKEGLVDDKNKRNRYGIKFDQSEDKKTRKAIMRKNIAILKTLVLISRKEDSIDLEDLASYFKMNVEEMKEFMEDLVQNGNDYRINGAIEGNIFKFTK